MRYKIFEIENYQTSRPAVSSGEGLCSIKHDISEVEQMRNACECKLVESLFYCVSELFEIRDVEMQTICDAHSFFMIKKDEGEIKHGTESVWLSRDKIRNASAVQVSGAIIDILLHRAEWSVTKTYKQLHLP